MFGRSRGKVEEEGKKGKERMKTRLGRRVARWSLLECISPVRVRRPIAVRVGWYTVGGNYRGNWS